MRQLNIRIVTIDKSMNRAEISSATVFPKLRLVLEEDIEFLKQMQKNREKNSAIYKLAGSLISAKRKILDKFPENQEGIGGAATTATILHMTGQGHKESKGDFALLSALNAVEKEQMEFVKHATVSEGMPKDLLKKLKEILTIYETITDQLNRSSKTGQINSVVV
jgi:hypothetical protein